MSYYPANIDVNNRKCLIIGGGRIAYGKAKQLSACGARIVVVSPQFLKNFKSVKGTSLVKRKFNPKDLKDAFLVIAATDDSEINTKVSAACFKRNTLVNVVDKTKFCNFVAPSIIRRGRLMITISTSGVSPAFSKEMRLELQKFYPNDFGRFLNALSGLRSRVLEEVADPLKRRKVLKGIASRKILDVLRKKGAQSAIKTAQAIVRKGGVEPPHLLGIRS